VISTHLHFNRYFPGVHGLAGVPSWSSSSTCSGREALGFDGTAQVYALSVMLSFSKYFVSGNCRLAYPSLELEVYRRCTRFLHLPIPALVAVAEVMQNVSSSWNC